MTTKVELLLEAKNKISEIIEDLERQSGFYVNGLYIRKIETTNIDSVVQEFKRIIEIEITTPGKLYSLGEA